MKKLNVEVMIAWVILFAVPYIKYGIVNDSVIFSIRSNAEWYANGLQGQPWLLGIWMYAGWVITSKLWSKIFYRA